MNLYTGLCLILAVSAWQAWRYSKTTVDPDWAMFNLAGFTGSWYGRDFGDCKTPGVHLWFYSLSRIVGADVARVKFLHHFLVGAVGMVVYLLSGSLGAGLAYTVLVNSGWLLAFHGNVGQVPAALIAVALCPVNPWLAMFLWGLALFYEPKLVVAWALWVVVNLGQLQVPALALSIAGSATVLVLRFGFRQVFDWLWEANVTITRRMNEFRKTRYTFFPWFTSQGLEFILPLLMISVYLNRDWKFWLPAVGYVGFIALSVIRQNHFIPLVPWIALSFNWQLALALLLVDFVSGGFYLGDIWQRFYMGIREINEEGRVVGEWLRDKPGSLWVNTFQTNIHIYSRKPIAFGMAEQAEMNALHTERRKVFVERWKAAPPDWVVTGPYPSVKFNPAAYQRLTSAGDLVIWKKR